MTAPAEQIGPYEIRGQLGRGSFGVVYRVARSGAADQPELALKVLLAADPVDVERFLREAGIARRLDHPGVVRVLDVGQHGVHAYYVMELCRGETLQQRLRRGPLPVGEAVRLVADLARAVEAMHADGVLHRDLKPGNVILDEATRRPRLTDFGLARDRSARSLTQTGEGLGTPHYMAPELFHDAKHADARADMWALGVILYECLTGRKPFDGDRFDEIAEAVEGAAPAPPRTLRREVPAALEALCLRALTKSAEERSSDAAAFADELEAILAGRIRGSRRSPALAFALGVLGAAVVLAVGGGVVYSMRSPRPGGSPQTVTAGPPPQAPPPRPAPPPPPPTRTARTAFAEAQRFAREVVPLDHVVAGFDEARRLAADDPVLRDEIDTAALVAISARAPATRVLERLARLDVRTRVYRRRVDLVAIFAHQRMKEYDRSRELLRRLIEEDPDDAIGIVAAAMTASLDGRPMDAVALDRAVALEPSLVPARMLRATRLLQARRPADALPDLEAAHEAIPNHADVLWHLATVLQDLRRIEEAIVPLDRLIALGGDEPDFEALYQRARMDLHLKRYADGRARLDKALEGRKDPVALMLRALMSWQLGEIERAEADWREAALFGARAFQQALDLRYRGPDLQAIIWSRVLGAIDAPDREMIEVATQVLGRLRQQVPRHADLQRFDGILALRRGRPLEEIVAPWRAARATDPAQGVPAKWLERLRELHPECKEIDALRGEKRTP